MIYRKYIKRGLDFLGALFLLMMLLPFVFIISVISFFTNNGIVFFSQKRVGTNESIFRLYKFATLSNDPNAKGQKVIDPVTKKEKTLSKWGKWLRNSSFDELPQLLNVIKGDLSLVGPRPLLPEYIGYFDDHEKVRHQIRPGITGLAQISGRNKVDWSQRFALDAAYVSDVSFGLDIIILLKTLKQLFQKNEVGFGESLIDYKNQLKLRQT